MGTLAEAAAIVDEVHAYFAKKTLFQWGIALRDDDHIIGTCTLSSVDPKNRRAELGYTLARDRWGQGLAHEAIVRLIEFAFGELRLRRPARTLERRRRDPARGFLRAPRARGRVQIRTRHIRAHALLVGV
ncbi:MAG: GNAT family N-acetyltransferase [Polyangiales bacterium]